MTDKELRKLKREDFIEIIYQYQRREQLLLQENAKLHQQLEDKYTRIRNAGSIAEAALSLNHVLEDVQAAADQYLEEIKALRDRAAGQEPQSREEAQPLEAEPLVQLPDMNLPQPRQARFPSDPLPVEQSFLPQETPEPPTLPQEAPEPQAPAPRPQIPHQPEQAEDDLGMFLKSIRDVIDR